MNGLAMHDLYRVLKRQSDLFVKRYGMAMYLKEHNSKVSAYHTVGFRRPNLGMLFSS